MQSKNNTQSAVQPKVITGTPWAWGFEDGAKGQSVYTGYHLFAGPKLTEYRKGWAEGKRIKQH